MKFSLEVILFSLSASATTIGAQFTPDPVNFDCGLHVTLDEVGSIDAGNLASPVAIGDDLVLIDHAQGKIFLDENGNGQDITEIFDISDAPAGLTFGYSDAIVEYIGGVSAGPSSNELYVVFQSSTLPDDLPVYGTGDLPEPIIEGHSRSFAGVAPASEPVDLYRIGQTLSIQEAGYCCLVTDIIPVGGKIYQSVYSFKYKKGVLSSPKPLVAFATQAGGTHKGGGMLTLPDGRLMFATGDGLPFGTNGREGAQDPTTSLSKIFAISKMGDVELLAVGLRQPQHLEFVDLGGNDENDQGGPTDLLVSFMDIGGVTAEEINVAPLADLLDTTTIENFGWGIAADGLGREGTFYTGPGIAGIFGTQPPAIGVAPSPEPGYIQPHAQFNRIDPSQFVAVTGPVTSLTSFSSIKVLFSNLPSGLLMATKGDLSNVQDPDFYGIDEEICAVEIVDVASSATFGTINEFVGSETRVDPRFFRFPDGTAGVLLEKTGVYYRITQI